MDEAACRCEKESLMIRRLVNSIKQSAGANWAASFIPLSGPV